MESVATNLFFKIARERQNILTKRNSGVSAPWTEDPIFQDWSFCNVRREDDKTTVWFRENIRYPLREDKLKVIAATMIFRWFNRIETGKLIKDLLLGEWDTEECECRLRHRHPIVTGAYIIMTMPGLNKLNGILHAIDTALPELEHLTADWDARQSLQLAWMDITRLPYIGPFMGYEIITDLRWTTVLNGATDINTWANAGPGCKRGLERIATQDWGYGALIDSERLIGMEHLLKLSREPKNWPAHYQPWEMREVEHWLCEYHKYCNALEGKRLKRRYHHDV